MPRAIHVDDAAAKVTIHLSRVWPARPICGAPRSPSTHQPAYVTCDACKAELERERSTSAACRTKRDRQPGDT